MKYTLVLSLLLLPTLAFAAEYSFTPLVGIPGIDAGEEVTLDSLINTLYALSISIAALLAVIKIVIAGVKYMVTDIVTSKGEAKKDIEGALLGLLVVLGAVLILTVINPNLAKVDISLDRIDQTSTPTTNLSPVLDTSKISTIAFSDGSVLSVQTPGLDSDQVSLFQQFCVGHALYSFEGGQQCAFPGTGKNIIPLPSGTSVQTYCLDEGGITLPSDPTPGQTWCSLPI